ncbi:MAG: putative quinol monooxygenase [Acidobacteriota bacterium]
MDIVDCALHAGSADRRLALEHPRRCGTCNLKQREAQMNLRKVLSIGTLALSSLGWGQQTGKVVVRIAELEIDPAQLDNYKAAVREEIEAAVRLEPGVIAIYSVAEKESPARIHFFEIYSSEEAYRSHVESQHFRKYAVATKDMIRAKKLIETTTVQLSPKMN